MAGKCIMVHWCSCMTDKQAYICPLCDTQMDSRIGIENHINGSTDDDHAGESGADHRADIEKQSVDEPASSAPDRAESADGSGTQPARFPAADRSDPADEPATDRADDRAEGGCCDDPELEEPDTRGAKLEDGTVIKFESGDRFCESCGAVVESDGTVMR